MPFAGRDGTRLYWRLDGDEHRPALLLLHALGTDMGMWDCIRAHLLTHFRLLQLDVRGHGASDAPRGDYRMEQLADDALAVMDAARVPRALVCGLSLGGMIAMSLALRSPGRVTGLVCACTSAQMDSATWVARVETVRREGVAAIAEAAMQRFFTPEFCAAHPEICGGVRSTLTSTSADGYAGCAAAIRDMDLIGRIGAIAIPTLLIQAEHDVSTPWAGHGERIYAAIPHAYVESLDSAHLACLESPQQFASLLWQFFNEVVQLAGRRIDGELPPYDADARPPRRLPGASARAAATASTAAAAAGGGAPWGAREREAGEVLFEAGLAVRRKVLGDAWVDRALASRTPFNADYQAMISRYAWHEIWGRPGLDPRTRRLLVLATTVALGRWEEFRLHVRAGLTQGGFSEQDLKEVLMQSAVYAGVPAANTAFTEAAAVMRELQEQR